MSGEGQKDISAYFVRGSRQRAAHEVSGCSRQRAAHEVSGCSVAKPPRRGYTGVLLQKVSILSTRSIAFGANVMMAF